MSRQSAPTSGNIAPRRASFRFAANTAKIGAALMLICAPASVRAQEAPGLAECSRAWLAHDYATVAVVCAEAATAQEHWFTEQTWTLEHDGLQPGMFDTYDMAYSSLVFAGQENARVAAAYARLKHGGLASAARARAIKDLTQAQASDRFKSDNPRSLYSASLRLLSFVQRKSFFKDAPQSEMLASDVVPQQ